MGITIYVRPKTVRVADSNGDRTLWVTNDQKIIKELVEHVSASARIRNMIRLSLVNILISRETRIQEYARYLGWVFPDNVITVK